MHKIWQVRKQREIDALRSACELSSVLLLVALHETDDEIRAMVHFETRTLVSHSGGIALAGPVLVGLRYFHEFLCAAPHPLEIATILQPGEVYHPNVAPNGAICLGHVQAGFTWESMLHLLWAGLNLNLSAVNLGHGDVVNREAAAFVRSRVDDFPISNKGLFEEPVERQQTSLVTNFSRCDVTKDQP